MAATKPSLTEMLSGRPLHRVFGGRSVSIAEITKLTGILRPRTVATWGRTFLAWRSRPRPTSSFAPDHPTVAINLNNLATILQDPGARARLARVFWLALTQR
jgi:hypothetical protein